jgi:hypothetical protein
MPLFVYGHAQRFRRARHCARGSAGVERHGRRPAQRGSGRGGSRRDRYAEGEDEGGRERDRPDAVHDARNPARGRVLRSSIASGQHPFANASALHRSSIRPDPSLVISSVSCAFGTVRTLSSEIAHSRGMPSSGPSGTSLTSPRMRVVTGATTTLRSPGIAASRVRTHTGRRPSTSRSSQKIAPRFTKALRGPPRGRSPPPVGPRAHSSHCPRALPRHRNTPQAQPGSQLRATRQRPAHRSSPALP